MTDDNKSHNTDLFFKAVETLSAMSGGKPALEQRIGAIYALERLSKQSEDHHIQIMEALCAYIRVNAPADDTRWPGLVLRNIERGYTWMTDEEIIEHPEFIAAVKGTGLTFAQLRRERDSEFEDVALEGWIQQDAIPRPDIRAVLDVIGRRSADRISYEQAQTPPFRLDLRRVKLRRADCKGLNLDHALFANSQLEGAFFHGAQLKEANFDGVQMQMAEFDHAQMHGAVLQNSQMERASFDETQLKKARFDHAWMESTVFSNSQMEGVEFNLVDLRRVLLLRCLMNRSRFQSFTMVNVDLQDSQMEGAQFRGGRMEKGNFGRAKMKGVEFHSVKMGGTHFIGADLNKARFHTRATLTNTDFLNTKMKETEFHSVQIKDTRFTGAQMKGVRFQDVKMEGTSFLFAQMHGSKFDHTRAVNVDFRGARMTEAEFRDTQMKSTDFHYSRVTGSPEAMNVPELLTLKSPVLHGGAMRFIDLSQVEFDENADFRNTFGDGSVTLPETMDRPRHWPNAVLDDEAFFGHWRGWIACGPNPDIWDQVAPEDFKDVPAIAPEMGHDWVKREETKG